MAVAPVAVTASAIDSFRTVIHKPPVDDAHETFKSLIGKPGCMDSSVQIALENQV